MIRIRSALSDRMRADDGMSVVELAVAMTLMTIFGGLFTSAIVLMNNSANKAESMTITSGQLNQAFLSLDKTVRYAAAISTPSTLTAAGAATPSGDWYVELRSTFTGTEICTQLRVDVSSQQLQRRTWSIVNNIASTPSSWRQLASNVTNGSAAPGPSQPFTLIPQAAGINFQKLTVHLDAKSGSSVPSTSSSTLTFTAMNSTDSTSASNVCQQAGRP